jgi:ABC-type nitrate/sulfonate/bicarbonate transport system substrate-binding protein
MGETITRRRLLAAGAKAAVLGALPGSFGWQSAHAAGERIRSTTGLRGASQCIAWIGAEAGVFARHGLELSFPKLEVGGPEAELGMSRGDWEFCQTGTLPIAEGFLNGRDPVILLRNTAAHVGLFVMTRRDVTALSQLAGKRVGVLTDAYSGQTGVNTRRTLEKENVSATYIGLGTYRKIYDALAAGDIEAGAIPIDLRFQGERDHGWHAFATASLGVPNVFATTRKRIAANRDVVLRAVRAMVETIHLFRTRPEVALPLFQRFLAIDSADAAADLYKFYVPLFPMAPAPALGEGLQDVRDTFAKKYPAAAKLQEADIVDASFIDEVERSGFIRDLYAADGKR